MAQAYHMILNSVVSPGNTDVPGKIFLDRSNAGQQLGRALELYAKRENAIVIALPQARKQEASNTR